MGRGRFLCFLLFLSALAWSGWAQAPPGDAVAEYEYYPDGLTRTIRHANGVVSAFDYFDNGRLRSVDTRAADGALVSRYEYDYDADGCRVEMREWNATPARRAADPLWAAAPAVTRYGHDNLGRLAWAEYRPADPGAPYRRVEYACDAAGNRLGETAREHAPDGAVRRTLKDRRFVIDNRNRLAAVIDALAPERSVRYLANAAGDTVARITGVMGPDGEIVPGTESHRLLFDWDAAGRLRRVRQATPGPDGAPVEELLAEFRYDYRGRRVAAHSRFVALGGDAVPAESRLYVYDGDAVLAEYGFEADGRTPYRARQYVYGDGLLTMEAYAPPGTGAPSPSPAGFERGTAAAGWPSPTGPPARAGVPGAGPNTSAAHPTLPDPASPRIITEADRFASCSGSSPRSAAPAYPTPGSSPACTPPVSTGSHLPSPVSPLPSPASRLASPVSPLPSPTGVYFYHLDALGSTVNLTAADGAVAEAYLYDAWGNYRELDVPAADVPAGWTWVVDPDLDANGLYCWATYQACLQGAFTTAAGAAAPDLNRITYTGHAFDPATGLYHFQARFYDPEAGRFLSADPYLGDPATPPSLHRFLYAYGDPLRYIDPTGRMTVNYTDRAALAGKRPAPPSQWGVPAELSLAEAAVHYDLRRIYGDPAHGAAEQYQVVGEKIRDKQSRYLATLSLGADDYDAAGNPRWEKIWREFTAATGGYARSITDLKARLFQAMREGGPVVDVSELFSDAHDFSAALTELTADRVATGPGPIGGIQRQASYVGQAGMAPEFTAAAGAAGLAADTAGWASLGLGAYRAGRITVELIQAARALPGEGNLIEKIGRILRSQSPLSETNSGWSPGTAQHKGAEAVEPITDPARMLPAGKSLPRNPFHHIFPQRADLAEKFAQAGVDVDKFTLQLPKDLHIDIHRGAPRGGLWNKAWDDFFKKNPIVRAEDIYKKAGELIHQFRIPGGPVVPYPRK